MAEKPQADFVWDELYQQVEQHDRAVAGTKVLIRRYGRRVLVRPMRGAGERRKAPLLGPALERMRQHYKVSG